MACEESRKPFHGANWMLADVSFAFFMLSSFILYLYKMERKSSKEYSVVFVVEGEKFKLRKLPSRFIFFFLHEGKIVLFQNTVE